MNLCRLVLLCAVIGLMTGVAQAQPGEQPGATPVFTLPEALEYANAHYPTVRAALEQVTASAANVDVARSAYLPRFDALWQTNHGTVNNIFGQLLPQSVIPSLSGPVLSSSSSDTVWGTAAGGLLSWEPFDFGLRGSTVREAEAAVNRARADEGVTRLAVQYAVALAFLNAVAAQQAVTAAEADVQRRQTIAQAARTLADNQLRPGAEASRADAERAAALTRAIQARQALAIARATLTHVLGLVDGPVTVNASALIDAAPPGTSAPAQDRSQHPLIQSGQAAVDLARARESVLSVTDRPRVLLQSSLFARGSGATPDAIAGGTDGLGFDRANWAAGVQIVFPNLFDFSSLRARRAAAGALTRAEGARYDETLLKVTSEERAAEAMVAATREIAQNTPIQLAAAQQSETQARARYEAGLASIVEIADTQNLLVQAEYLNAVARVDVWRALLSQAVARGTLGTFIDALRASGVQ
jgi:outer membrane protein TolC